MQVMSQQMQQMNPETQLMLKSKPGLHYWMRRWHCIETVSGS